MEYGNRNVGSVKAAINRFGERVLDGRPPASDRQRMNLTEVIVHENPSVFTYMKGVLRHCREYELGLLIFVGS